MAAVFWLCQIRAFVCHGEYLLCSPVCCFLVVTLVTFIGTSLTATKTLSTTRQSMLRLLELELKLLTTSKNCIRKAPYTQACEIDHSTHEKKQNMQAAVPRMDDKIYTVKCFIYIYKISYFGILVWFFKFAGDYFIQDKIIKTRECLQRLDK